MVEGSVDKSAPGTLDATTFAFHVTYTCPLACAHCCFGSSPTVRDTLDPTFILDCIANLPASLRLVAFTGGEPFLHNRLADYVGAAKQRGFRTRVVTSGYFGKTYASAKKRLQPVIDAGLDEISLSWDDYHEEYVDFACVRNVAQIAVEANLTTAISSVVAANTVWNRAKVVAELGALADRVDLIRDSHLNLTGRGEELLQDAGFLPAGYLGPCPFVLTGPTLSAKGKLLACCGVIPDAERLAIAETVRPSELGNAIDDSFSDPLFLWLYLRGPFALIEQIAARYGFAVPDRNRVGGNCEACKILFETKYFVARMDDFLKEKMVELAGELILLQSLSLLNAKDIGLLWQSNSLTRFQPDIAAAPPA